MDSEIKQSQISDIIRAMSEAQTQISSMYNYKMFYVFSSDRESYRVWIDEVPDSESTINIHDWINNPPAKVSETYKEMAKTKFENSNNMEEIIETKQSLDESAETIETKILELIDLASSAGIEIFPCIYYDTSRHSFCVRLHFNDDYKTFSSLSLFQSMMDARSFILEQIEKIKMNKIQEEIERKIKKLQEELKNLNS